MDFHMIENDNPLGTIIKVIGVGGAGNNAVEHMISRRIQGVEFICMNTDAQALRRSNAKYKLQLGKTGLGAGARPEVGRAAADEAREEIKHLLQGANMVFITAGMGGGTGTGAAPVVAKIAKEMGILTVGVVSKPFEFEGLKRMNIAENGANELQAHVDSLIVVLNERLFAVMGEDAEMDKCFQCADDVLNNAVAGIAEIINVDGLINVDFEDVKTVMSEQGKAMMGTATVEGADRARLAAEQAVSSPLLEGVDLSGARGVLVNITASRSLKLSETKQVMNTIRSYAAKEATVIFGSVYSEECGDALRVTVVATGLGANEIKNAEAMQANAMAANVNQNPYQNQNHQPAQNNQAFMTHAQASFYQAAYHAQGQTQLQVPASGVPQSNYSHNHFQQESQHTQNQPTMANASGLQAANSQNNQVVNNNYQGQNHQFAPHAQSSQISAAQAQQNVAGNNYYTSPHNQTTPIHSSLSPQINTNNTQDDSQNFAATSGASLWNAQNNTANPTEKRTVFEDQPSVTNVEASGDIYDIPAFLRRQTTDAS
jgi:cell division protein FtsZ